MITRLLLLTILFFWAALSNAQPPSAEQMAQSRVHFNSGVRLGIDEDFEKAVEAFQKAIELNPLYAEAFLYKGLARIELAEYDEAIRNFTITIEIDPAYSDQAHYFRGVARYHNQQYPQSIDDLTIAIRMNPDYAAFYQRGKANLKLKEYVRSLQDFEISLRLQPDFYDAYLHRGINLYYLQEYEYAVEDLEIAKKNLPKNAEAFYYSGLARTAIKNSYVAIEDLNRAIELNPAFALAYEARATARENTGHHQEATKDRLRAQEQAAQVKPQAMPAAFDTPAPPQRSTEINFEELFTRSQPRDTSQDQLPAQSVQQEEHPALQTAIDDRQEGSRVQKNIAQLSSGTYDKLLDAVNPSGFGVQVASYSNTDNLLRLADAYHQRFEKPVFVNVSNVNGRTLYKLIIGTFNARAEAEGFRDQLRRGDFSDSFLVVFSNL